MINGALSSSCKLGLIAASLASILLVSGSLSAQDSSVPSRPVKLIEIITKARVEIVTLPAIVQPSTLVDLTVQVGGVLVAFPVQEGEQINKGDLIAQIDKTNYQNAVDQAQAQFDNAQDEYRRARTLVAQQAVSRSTFEKRKATRDVAKLTLAAAKVQLDDTTLVAPFDGIIAKTSVKKYQTVGQKTQVVTLQGRSDFEALANVPAQTVASSPNFEVEETILILDVAPLQKIPVTFKLLAPQADPASQTYEIKFTFTPPEGLVVLAGMTGELRSSIRNTGDLAGKTAIQVPISAILYDGTKTYVWIVDVKTMTVSRHAVTVAEAIGKTLPILKGLSAGDTIVGAGASYLHEGMKIRRFKAVGDKS